MDVTCFMMTALPKIRRWLRRYSLSSGSTGYYNAMNLLDEIDSPLEGVLEAQEPAKILGPDWQQDPRWPTHSETGELFVDTDAWQIFTKRLYKHPDGREIPQDEFEPGAMWYAHWLDEFYPGPDGRCLAVRLPNGRDWMIDTRASNCDMPDDKVHRCWVRHGEVPNITVDKLGVTCNAGGGSIWTNQGKPDEWHGFLREGRLIKC